MKTAWKNFGVIYERQRPGDWCGLPNQQDQFAVELGL